MKLPQMVNRINKSKKYTINFRGINRGSNCSEGELWDCFNLSSDNLPYLSQRGAREQLGEFKSPTAVHAHNGIAVVDGTSFLYKADDEEEFTEKITVTEGKKEIAQLGDRILIYPDKISYNVSTNKAVPLEAEIALDRRYSHYTDSSAYIWFTEVYHNRIETEDILVSDGIRVNGVEFESYKAKELYEKFEVGDVISTSGGGYKNNGSTFILFDVEKGIIRRIERSGRKTTVYFDDDTFFSSLEHGTSTYLMMKNELTIKKEAKNLVHLCEHGGRVWGTDGQEIYASAYNDIKSFDRFEGVSSDSYALSVSTPGEFTACAAYSSHIIFFKEDSIHRIYGNRPSNFNMVVSSAPGVQKGSYNSVKMLNDRLFYKGVDGVYMYGGGVPTLISSCLGQEKYTDAVAGVWGNKYYISMKNSKGEYELFVYDMLNNVFFKEDNTELVDTAQKDGELLILEKSGKLMKINGSTDTKDIEWSAELREFNEVINERKGYSRLTLRAELEEKSYINVEIATDSGRFEVVKTVSRPGKNVICISIPPNRCDSFKLRFSGKGGCRVENLVREFVTGGEVW